ncbi:putative glucan endo-1,6-beta-glucosidase B [Lophiotrema nucula]|uniref:glucan endo-1,6-beta-glucosidase n=1 Tax=Lophiotrema nucula TaxID=690887 RepID=A0A6A5Z778_9PLEO|nr:putative glucan endo-1,6-beta-glucosidase B [Lophiotrema nucula]
MKTNLLALLALLAFSAAVYAWLPQDRASLYNTPSTKIRGVNLGSLFIIEPWMAPQEWKEMGCKDTHAEDECVAKLGQNVANAAFQQHWETYITADDLDRMKTYGLNTIRVPVGFWIVEDLVKRDIEHFPQGGMVYLDRLVDWAAQRGIFVILDLHGAPGAQSDNPFTGYNSRRTSFFTEQNYQRATSFLANLTHRIHSNDIYRTTGMIEVLNEPERHHDDGNDNLLNFYAAANKMIRDIENEKNIPKEQRLTIQYMDASWGAGDPKSVMKNEAGIAYDNHRYLKWAWLDSHTKASYHATSCNDSFNSTLIPLVIGEWSLSVKDEKQGSEEFNPEIWSNRAWYKQWWAAQIQAYEKQAGWIFWSWKAEGDWRWSYKNATEVGVIPTDPNAAYWLAQC